MKTRDLVLMKLSAITLLAIMLWITGCDKGDAQSTKSSKAGSRSAVSSTGSESTAQAEKPAAETAVSAVEQTTCPVMEGRPINKEIFTTYQGKTVYFCCEGCKPDFESNPEKYLSKLPQFKK